MRTGMLVAGIVILIIGVVLWYLPVQPVSNSLTVPTGAGDTLSANPPLAVLTSQLTYSASWTASSSITVNVYDCGTDSACSNAIHSGAIATGTGSSGSLSWTGPKGEYYLIVPSSTATVTAGATEPLAGGLVGVALLVVGLIIAIVGAVRGPAKAKASPAPAAAPAAAPPAAAPPAAPPSP